MGGGVTKFLVLNSNINNSGTGYRNSSEMNSKPNIRIFYLKKIRVKYWIYLNNLVLNNKLNNQNLFKKKYRNIFDDGTPENI